MRIRIGSSAHLDEANQDGKQMEARQKSHHREFPRMGDQESLHGGGVSVRILTVN